MKVLFLAPYTDDVELGAGGPLFKFLENGYEILGVAHISARASLSLSQMRTCPHFVDFAF
jgi:hypothetical protein